MIEWIKKRNNLQISKVQPRGDAWLLLDFLPISVAYKSVVYKKAHITNQTTGKDNFVQNEF